MLDLRDKTNSHLPSSAMGWKEHLDRCLVRHRAGHFERPATIESLTRERDSLERLWKEGRQRLFKQMSLLFVGVLVGSFLVDRVTGGQFGLWIASGALIAVAGLGLWICQSSSFFQSPRASTRLTDLTTSVPPGRFFKRLVRHPALNDQVTALQSDTLGLLHGDRRVIEKYMVDLKHAKR